jgi:hypothetical protein
MRTRNRIADQRVISRPYRTPHEGNPCIGLITAVVDKAISDVRSYADLVNGKRMGSDWYLRECRKFAVSGWNWIKSDCPNEPGRLTFVFCCEALDMDPERIRVLLARLIGPTAVYRLNN